MVDAFRGDILDGAPDLVIVNQVHTFEGAILCDASKIGECSSRGEQAIDLKAGIQQMLGEVATSKPSDAGDECAQSCSPLWPLCPVPG